MDFVKKFLFLMFVSWSVFAKDFCDDRSILLNFESVYDIQRNRSLLKRFQSSLTSKDLIYFHQLAEKFQSLGFSEQDLQEKFKLQNESRNKLRILARKQSWPILNSSSGGFDLVFREEKTQDKILNSVYELRILLGVNPVQPEIVIWKFINQARYNPFLVNRIVLRLEPETILVNYRSMSAASQWYALHTFFKIFKQDYCFSGLGFFQGLTSDQE